MSFLVLVLGAVLSFGGVAALYSGYGNVEVARGWTAVIAGTTALSAGVMTIGISFVLRCLVRLQTFLEIERGLVPLLNEIALNRDLTFSRAHSAGGEGAGASMVQPTVLVAAATFAVGEQEADDADEATQPLRDSSIGGSDRSASARPDARGEAGSRPGGMR